MLAESEIPLRRESELVTVAVSADSSAVGEQIVDLPLPVDVTVLLIHRDGGFFAPNGATVLHAGDRLMALTSRSASARFRAILEG
jgi:cell volume regulation protein A